MSAWFRAGLTCLLAASAAVVQAGSAEACADSVGCTGPGRTYHVIATDGSLAVQRNPVVGDVVRWVGGDGTALLVDCQITDGGTDPYDGLNSRTWDRLVGGGWVYDHFVDTPPQGPDGGSEGVPSCAEPSASALVPAITVPDLYPRQIRALGQTAGPLFLDGPGFGNGQVAQSLDDAEGVGYCQNLVLANTDFWWLTPAPVVNDVFTWADLSSEHGRTVLDHPVVGAVVVFRAGWHDGWSYDTGHVAMVMRTYSDGSFTVAEFNWNAGGGGRHVLDLRRVSAADDAPLEFIR